MFKFDKSNERVPNYDKAKLEDRTDKRAVGQVSDTAQVKAQLKARRNASEFRLKQVKNELAKTSGDLANFDETSDMFAKRACTSVARLAVSAASSSHHQRASVSKALLETRQERLLEEIKFFSTEAEHLNRIEKLLDKEINLERDGNVKEKPESQISTAVTRKKFMLHFDGASKNNPGEAGAGWILRHDDGLPVAFGWKYVGDTSTNNEAEYTAFIEGLSYVKNHMGEFGTIDVLGDSNLVVQQVLGNWKCKAANLVPFVSRAKNLVESVSEHGKVNLKFVPREQNQVADYLSNLAVKSRNAVVQENIREVVDVAYLRSRFGNL